MQVEVTTKNLLAEFNDSTKTINWNNSSDRKWLMNHLHWAMNHFADVTLSRCNPESN